MGVAGTDDHPLTSLLKVEEEAAQFLSLSCKALLPCRLTIACPVKGKRAKNHQRGGAASYAAPPDGMMAFDRDLRYKLWNSTMERMTGVRHLGSWGHTVSEKFPLQRLR